MCAWIWMKCCVSTDVGTWTNWLTFEPDPDYDLDARTGLLSPVSYKWWYAEFYIGETPTYAYWHGLPLQRCVVLKWFYSLGRRNTFVGSTCALPNALLVGSEMKLHTCIVKWVYNWTTWNSYIHISNSKCFFSKHFLCAAVLQSMLPRLRRSTVFSL